MSVLRNVEFKSRKSGNLKFELEEFGRFHGYQKRRRGVTEDGDVVLLSRF